MKKFDLKNVVEKVKTTDYKKLAKDFWYGKPHGERRLGDLYCDKTGLYKHREWRGVKDTFYYFNKVWLYNYGMLVYDVMRYGGIWTFAKGCWRYRWMGQTYLPVLHWFDRGMEGLRGEALRACPLHYRAMTNATIYQFMQMFRNDLNTNKGNKKVQARHDKTIAHDETVWGGIFYPFSKEVENVPLQMIPYFVTCHVNNHTVLNYIDAVQSLGLPGDPCPMCQAEAGLFVLDDVPDYYKAVITSNEACDGSVATSIIQDWLIDKPLFAMPQPMQFDDPLVHKHCMKEIEEAWKFIEEQTGVPFDYQQLCKVGCGGQHQLLSHQRRVPGAVPYLPVSVRRSAHLARDGQEGPQDHGEVRGAAHQQLPADPPPRHCLVLCAAVLFQLVHLVL